MHYYLQIPNTNSRGICEHDKLQIVHLVLFVIPKYHKNPTNTCPVIPASFTAVLVVSRCLENNEHFCERSREIPSDSSAENIRVSAIRACLSKNLEARRPGCRDHERRHWGYTSPPTEGNLQKTTSVEYQK